MKKYHLGMVRFAEHTYFVHISFIYAPLLSYFSDRMHWSLVEL
jgi:hypothetical protein